MLMVFAKALAVTGKRPSSSMGKRRSGSSTSWRSLFGNDRTFPTAIMPDQLHPSAFGYPIWAEAMGLLLKDLIR